MTGESQCIVGDFLKRPRSCRHRPKYPDPLSLHASASPSSGDPGVAGYFPLLRTKLGDEVVAQAAHVKRTRAMRTVTG